MWPRVQCCGQTTGHHRLLQTCSAFCQKSPCPTTLLRVVRWCSTSRGWTLSRVCICMAQKACGSDSMQDSVTLLCLYIAPQHYLKQEATAAYAWSRKRLHSYVNSHDSMMNPMPEAHCKCWHSSGFHILFVTNCLLATSVCIAVNAALYFVDSP